MDSQQRPCQTRNLSGYSSAAPVSARSHEQTILPGTSEHVSIPIAMKYDDQDDTGDVLSCAYGIAI